MTKRRNRHGSSDTSELVRAARRADDGQRVNTSFPNGSNELRYCAIREMTMKKTILLIAVCSVSVGAMARGSGGHSKGSSSGSGHVNSSSHSVSGHITKSGTYVAPARATNPNKTKSDNYSQKGNTNPNTGKPGTKQ